MIYKVLSKQGQGLLPDLFAVARNGLVAILLQRILGRIIVYRQVFPSCCCAGCGPVFATSVPVYPGGPAGGENNPGIGEKGLGDGLRTGKF